jgi:hypothetical protein
VRDAIGVHQREAHRAHCLIQQHSRLRQELLVRFLQANKPGRAAVVAIYQRVVIANPRAARMFEGLDSAGEPGEDQRWHDPAVHESPERGAIPRKPHGYPTTSNVRRHHNLRRRRPRPQRLGRYRALKECTKQPIIAENHTRGTTQ